MTRNTPILYGWAMLFYGGIIGMVLSLLLLVHPLGWYVIGFYALCHILFFLLFELPFYKPTAPSDQEKPPLTRSQSLLLFIVGLITAFLATGGASELVVVMGGEG